MSKRRQGRQWTEFVAWCGTRGLRALPAHPWTVAAYARWCETRQRYPAIVLSIRAISRVHLLACVSAPDRHPTVSRTLRMIEMRHRLRGERSSLFRDEDVAGAKAAAAPSVKRKSGAKERVRRAMRSGPPLVRRRGRSRLDRT